MTGESKAQDAQGNAEENHTTSETIGTQAAQIAGNEPIEEYTAADGGTDQSETTGEQPSLAAQYVEMNQELKQVLENLRESILRYQETLNKVRGLPKETYLFPQDYLFNGIESVLKSFRWFKVRRDGFFESEKWETMKKEFPGITEEDGADLFFCGLVDPIIKNLQGIKQKIADYEQLHECTLCFHDIVSTANINDQGLTLIEQFIRELERLDASTDETGSEEQGAETAQHTIIKRANNIDYPIDKINSIIWNLVEKDTKGQVTFNMAKHGSDKQILTYYSINFDELGSDITITKRLLPFDKLAYIAIAALYNAGNNVITLSQIYYAMGHTGRPGKRNLEKINDSITKMTTARIFVDNEQEAGAYKYKRFKYDGSLLPVERGTAIVNGKFADAAIHIFREPPLIDFARKRKQITTIDIKLLQAPVNKTDVNLLIQDYLLERISRAKNGKENSCRILYKSIYEHTGIKDKPKTNAEKQKRKRAPQKIEEFLKHYQKEKYISRFIMEKDGITVFW